MRLSVDFILKKSPLISAFVGNQQEIKLSQEEIVWSHILFKTK
jgi:hypothetical protein